MGERTVRLTDEQIRILRSITGPRIASDPGNRYGDWSVDLDRRLREAAESRVQELEGRCATCSRAEEARREAVSHLARLEEALGEAIEGMARNPLTSPGPPRFYRPDVDARDIERWAALIRPTPPSSSEGPT
jgi:hypothetical protein